MKLEKLAALAEIVSSFAIVATLLYLAIQTKQNTEALQTAAQQATLDGELDWLNSVIAYPEVLLKDRDDLTITDRARLTAFAAKLLRTRELIWIQYNNGILDEQTFLPYLGPMRGLFSPDRPVVFEILEQYSGNPEFKTYLLEYLEGPP